MIGPPRSRHSSRIYIAEQALPGYVTTIGNVLAGVTDPITGPIRYLTRGVYLHVWHEVWAYRSGQPGRGLRKDRQ